MTLVPLVLAIVLTACGSSSSGKADGPSTSGTRPAAGRPAAGSYRTPDGAVTVEVISPGYIDVVSHAPKSCYAVADFFREHGRSKADSYQCYSPMPPGGFPPAK